MKFSLLAATALTAAPTVAEVYFKEQFDNDYTKRWVESSKWKPKAEMGKFEHTAGEWYGDKEDKGIQTSEDARFYGISAKMDKTFTSAGKDLVLQYTVKHEQNLDCGGAYIKLMPGNVDQAKFGGDTPYSVMFGPDICGSSNKRTHVILHSNPKDENLLVKKDVSTETDELTHLYTLVVKADNTFDVRIDNKSVRSGKLEEEFDFLEEKEIKDPDASKPKDWVDEAKIADPEDEKPDGYDEIPDEIPDPDASKPDDWDDEDDGDWEPPMIDNPDYKGPWSPKMIDNPDYKGGWVHPKIPNPEYKYDDTMYQVCKDGCNYVGFELWQVKTGSLFDDIIITDSLEEAQQFAEETYFKKKEGEKNMYDKIQEEKREAEMADMDDDDMDDDEEDLDGFEDEF
jgi:calreticulin